MSPRTLLYNQVGRKGFQHRGRVQISVLEAVICPRAGLHCVEAIFGCLLADGARGGFQHSSVGCCGCVIKLFFGV